MIVEEQAVVVVVVVVAVVVAAVVVAVVVAAVGALTLALEEYDPSYSWALVVHRCDRATLHHPYEKGLA